jgi:uncharacterized Tic20 family protein
VGPVVWGVEGSETRKKRHLGKLFNNNTNNANTDCVKIALLQVLDVCISYVLEYFNRLLGFLVFWWCW